MGNITHPTSSLQLRTCNRFWWPLRINTSKLSKSFVLSTTGSYPKKGRSGGLLLLNLRLGKTRNSDLSPRNWLLLDPRPPKRPVSANSILRTSLARNRNSALFVQSSKKLKQNETTSLSNFLGYEINWRRRAASNRRFSRRLPNARASWSSSRSIVPCSQKLKSGYKRLRTKRMRSSWRRTNRRQSFAIFKPRSSVVPHHPTPLLDRDKSPFLPRNPLLLLPLPPFHHRLPRDRMPSLRRLLSQRLTRWLPHES